MSLRRVALALVVALTATTTAVGATTAQASSGTICVALVVDGTALGSNVSTSCATVNKGATGVAVLEAAGHAIGYRNDGLICTIDGLPKTGCSAVDDSHFWAYFHRAPGATSWTYSTEGAATYRPANTSTEGWVYRDGTDAVPANVPYGQICKTTPTKSATPAPSHHPSHHPSVSPTPKHHTLPGGGGTIGATPTATAPHRSHQPSRPHVHRRHHRDHHPRSTPAPVTAPPTISPSSAALIGGSTSSSGGGSATGLIIGIVAVLVLGSAATYRFRRGSSRP